jgi:hypothetical protein
LLNAKNLFKNVGERRSTSDVVNLRPIILLDFDEVIVLNRPGDVGGFDVIFSDPPQETWMGLFHKPAIQTLVDAITEHQARVVITTSWLRFMMREGFERVFERTALEVISKSLHESWEAPQHRGETRAQAIDRWLSDNHHGEPYVILDDELSGTGLRTSLHEQRKRVVFCEVDVGLTHSHLPFIRAALSKKS